MTKKVMILFGAVFALSFLASGCVIVTDDDDTYVCGDGICDVDLGEDAINCPSDCAGYCGDGICDINAGENDDSCPTDCNAANVCDDMDYWLATCYPDCKVTWDCEYNYESYDDVTRDDLAFCATCLADDAHAGVCDAGCNVNDEPCEDILADLLDVNCWKK